MFKIKFYKKKEENIKNEFEDYLNNIKDNHIKTYIKERLIAQINWYDKKSIHNQKVYTRLIRFSIIMSGSIPVLTVFADLYWIMKVIISVFSAVVTIISSIIAMSNYKELWNEYRKNCEMLKSCLYLYFTRQGIYKELTDEEAFCELVTICEEKFVEEFDKWEQLNSDKKNNGNVVEM